MTSYRLYAAVILTVGQLLSFGAFADTAPCPNPKSNEALEIQIAQIAGEAILYPGDPEVGTDWATRCLLGWFHRTEFSLAGAGPIVSDSLLAIMAADPTTFFHAAAKADPKQVDGWLGRTIRVSQLRGLGACVVPDRFVQARRAIAELSLSKPPEEEMRRRIIDVLGGLKCRVAS